MAVEVTVVLWLDDEVPVPTREEIEEEFDCHVLQYEVEYEV